MIVYINKYMLNILKLTFPFVYNQQHYCVQYYHCEHMNSSGNYAGAVIWCTVGTDTLNPVCLPDLCDWQNPCKHLHLN